MASPAPTRASSATSANCAERAIAGSVRHHRDGARAKSRRSITAPAPWSAIAQTGKYRRTRLFVLTLGFSRKCVRLLCFHSSARIWAELHEQAFRRLGGTTKVVVLDNLKEGVLKPDIYDPALNPLYRDVLAHYGVVPALPGQDPDRKGKVESGVGHARRRR
jgi:transposase